MVELKSPKIQIAVKTLIFILIAMEGVIFTALAAQKIAPGLVVISDEKVEATAADLLVFALSALDILINIGFTVVYAVWLYQFHVDCGRLFPNYAVTPGQALARFLIPIYNLWGLWSIHKTLVDRKREHESLKDEGNYILRFLALYYLFAVINILLFQALPAGELKSSRNLGLAAAALVSGVMTHLIFLFNSNAMNAIVKIRARDKAARDAASLPAD